eukprot:TRINITY_DN1423_c0_g2_i3.p1 TRINITY_DN1423_c0_g2~~TRINITY_DN1423_c0_g2_i3.p1  ORF type:complete len:2218 (+),score=841.54 TRINITY_DN1423_c0_g2_i3:996-6656(+)
MGVTVKNKIRNGNFSNMGWGGVWAADYTLTWLKAALKGLADASALGTSVFVMDSDYKLVAVNSDSIQVEVTENGQKDRLFVGGGCQSDACKKLPDQMVTAVRWIHNQSLVDSGSTQPVSDVTRRATLRSAADGKTPFLVSMRGLSERVYPAEPENRWRFNPSYNWVLVISSQTAVVSGDNQGCVARQACNEQVTKLRGLIRKNIVWQLEEETSDHLNANPRSALVSGIDHDSGILPLDISTMINASAAASDSEAEQNKDETVYRALTHMYYQMSTYPTQYWIYYGQTWGAPDSDPNTTECCSLFIGYRRPKKEEGTSSPVLTWGNTSGMYFFKTTVDMETRRPVAGALLSHDPSWRLRARGWFTGGKAVNVKADNQYDPQNWAWTDPYVFSGGEMGLSVIRPVFPKGQFGTGAIGTVASDYSLGPFLHAFLNQMQMSSRGVVMIVDGDKNLIVNSAEAPVTKMGASGKLEQVKASEAGNEQIETTVDKVFEKYPGFAGKDAAKWKALHREPQSFSYTDAGGVEQLVEVVGMVHPNADHPSPLRWVVVHVAPTQDFAAVPTTMCPVQAGSAPCETAETYATDAKGEPTGSALSTDNAKNAKTGAYGPLARPWYTSSQEMAPNSLLWTDAYTFGNGDVGVSILSKITAGGFSTEDGKELPNWGGVWAVDYTVAALSDLMKELKDDLSANAVLYGFDPMYMLVGTSEASTISVKCTSCTGGRVSPQSHNNQLNSALGKKILDSATMMQERGIRGQTSRVMRMTTSIGGADHFVDYIRVTDMRWPADEVLPQTHFYDKTFDWTFVVVQPKSDVTTPSGSGNCVTTASCAAERDKVAAKTRSRMMKTIREETADHLNESPRSALVTDSDFDEGILTADLSKATSEAVEMADADTLRTLEHFFWQMDAFPGQYWLYYGQTWCGGQRSCADTDANKDEPGNLFIGYRRAKPDEVTSGKVCQGCKVLTWGNTTGMYFFATAGVRDMTATTLLQHDANWRLRARGWYKDGKAIGEKADPFTNDNFKWTDAYVFSGGEIGLSVIRAVAAEGTVVGCVAADYELGSFLSKFLDRPRLRTKNGIIVIVDKDKNLIVNTDGFAVSKQGPSGLVLKPSADLKTEAGNGPLVAQAVDTAFQSNGYSNTGIYASATPKAETLTFNTKRYTLDSIAVRHPSGAASSGDMYWVAVHVAPEADFAPPIGNYSGECPDGQLTQDQCDFVVAPAAEDLRDRTLDQVQDETLEFMRVAVTQVVETQRDYDMGLFKPATQPPIDLNNPAIRSRLKKHIYTQMKIYPGLAWIYMGTNGGRVMAGSVDSMFMGYLRSNGKIVFWTCKGKGTPAPPAKVPAAECQQSVATLTDDLHDRWLTQIHAETKEYMAIPVEQVTEINLDYDMGLLSPADGVPINLEHMEQREMVRKHLFNQMLLFPELTMVRAGTKGDIDRGGAVADGFLGYYRDTTQLIRLWQCAGGNMLLDSAGIEHPADFNSDAPLRWVVAHTAPETDFAAVPAGGSPNCSDSSKPLRFSKCAGALTRTGDDLRRRILQEAWDGVQEYMRVAAEQVTEVNLDYNMGLFGTAAGVDLSDATVRGVLQKHLFHQMRIFPELQWTRMGTVGTRPAADQFIGYTRNSSTKDIVLWRCKSYGSTSPTASPSTAGTAAPTGTGDVKLVLSLKPASGGRPTDADVEAAIEKAVCNNDAACKSRIKVSTTDTGKDASCNCYKTSVTIPENYRTPLDDAITASKDPNNNSTANQGLKDVGADALAAPTASTESPTTKSDDGGGSSPVVPIVVGLAVLLIGAGAFFVLKKKSAAENQKFTDLDKDLAQNEMKEAPYHAQPDHQPVQPPPPQPAQPVQPVQPTQPHAGRGAGLDAPPSYRTAQSPPSGLSSQRPGGYRIAQQGSI